MKSGNGDGFLSSRATNEWASLLFHLVHASMVFQYYILSAITLLYYDYLLTLFDEIKYVWRNKFSLISYVFVLNRYLSVVGYIPIVYFYLGAPVDKAEACRRFEKLPGVLGLLTQTAIVAVMIARTYALYQKSIFILVLTSSVGLMTVALSIWSLLPVSDKQIGLGFKSMKSCLPTDLLAVTPFKASCLANIAFDTLVFILTVHRTWKMRRASPGMKNGVVELFVRDGSLYYCTMAAANLVNYVLFTRNVSSLTHFTYFEQSAGNNSLLNNTISTILLSRLILNIRQFSNVRVYQSRRYSSGGAQLTTELTMPRYVPGIRTGMMRAETPESAVR